MPRRPAHHHVKIHLVYSLAEAAETLGVHRKTVARWIRTDGLLADRTRKPWLIRGQDLKTWLIDRRTNRRSPLQPGEIFCLPCRAPKRPAFDEVDFRSQKGRSGMLVGLCPDCERLIHRAASHKDTQRHVEAGLKVTFT